MAKFHVRITRITKEVFTYSGIAPDLAAAQFTAETSEPDVETRKVYDVSKRVRVVEIKSKP